MLTVLKGFLAPSEQKKEANGRQALVRDSSKRTRELFAADFGQQSGLISSNPPAFKTIESPLDLADQVGLASRIRSEYEDVRELPSALAAKQTAAATAAVNRRKKQKSHNVEPSDTRTAKLIEGIPSQGDISPQSSSTALTVRARNTFDRN